MTTIGLQAHPARCLRAQMQIKTTIRTTIVTFVSITGAAPAGVQLSLSSKHHRNRGRGPHLNAIALRDKR